MSFPNPSTALASIVVDELVRRGVQFFVVAPGSRSTALALAVDAHPGAALTVAIDERSAAFHALGSVKASGAPAAVLTTSGTAVANLLPAVVEADADGMPLVVLTADRPTELRGVGANQAIDQRDLFGSFVRLALEWGPAELTPSAPDWWRSMVAQASAAADGFGGRPGPIHLNLLFREPTVPTSDDGRVRAEPYPFMGRVPLPAPPRHSSARMPAPDAVANLTDRIADVRRGVIVAGGGVGGSTAVTELGSHLGWPVLASAESGLRGTSGAIATGHHLVDRMQPEVILRFGTTGPSRRVLELLSGPTSQIVVGRTWSDPARVAEIMVDADPGLTARAIIEATSGVGPGRWLEWWWEADRLVQETLVPELSGEVTEPAVAAEAGRADAELMVVGSSMPIRDVEAYAFAPPRVVGNRGASGIDGFVSTALGAARHSSRVLALAGDLSILHDSNGFLVDEWSPVIFVVVDNSGGGIFSLLPQARYAGPGFERLFATPHGRDLARLAEFHGLWFEQPDTLDDFRATIEEGWKQDRPGMVIVRTDRDQNVAEHTRLARLVDEALKGLGPPPDH